MGILEDLFITSGAITGINASLVVLTGVAFPDMLLSRERIFSHIVFCISFCDMMTGVAFMMGFPENPTVCLTQGILGVFFTMGSWVWTAVLVYQLRCTLIYGSVLRRAHIHLVAWSITLLFSCLPMVDDVYFGNDDAIIGSTSCDFGGHSKHYWILFDYFGVLMASFLVMIVCTLDVRWRYSGSQSAMVVYRTMRLYPLAMTVAWFPLLVFSVYVVASNTTCTSDTCVASETSLQIVGSQYGSATAIIFFASTREPWDRWKQLLLGVDDWNDSSSASSFNVETQSRSLSESVSGVAASQLSICEMRICSTEQTHYDGHAHSKHDQFGIAGGISSVVTTP